MRRDAQERRRTLRSIVAALLVGTSACVDGGSITLPDRTAFPEPKPDPAPEPEPVPEEPATDEQRAARAAE